MLTLHKVEHFIKFANFHQKFKIYFLIFLKQIHSHSTPGLRQCRVNILAATIIIIKDQLKIAPVYSLQAQCKLAQSEGIAWKDIK